MKETKAILADIEQKLMGSMLSTDDLIDVLNQEPTKNSTAVYVRELIATGIITKAEVSKIVSKHIEIEEQATAQLIEQFGE